MEDLKKMAALLVEQRDLLAEAVRDEAKVRSRIEAARAESERIEKKLLERVGRNVPRKVVVVGSRAVLIELDRGVSVIDVEN